jgi:hypothetical protein
MQARWVAFARDGTPADRSDWPAYGDGGRITIIDGVPAHGRIDDEPVVPLQHAARTTSVGVASHSGLGPGE